MSELVVTGAIVSKNGLTLFTNEGNSVVFSDTDYRVKDMIAAVMVPLATQESVKITVESYSIAKKIAENSNGRLQVEEDARGNITSVKTDTGAEIKSAEKIDRLVQLAAEGYGAEALANFIERFNRIPHQHSADELLNFIKNGDLPLADDGSIIAYKFLTKEGDFFVDTHTRKVRQKVGSMVVQDNVNLDRRTECATGLHVCSNKYGQYGNELFIVKIDPADVLAVPYNENGKMRCRAYHIVAHAPGKLLQTVGNRRSALEDKSGKKLIENIVAGNHVDVLEIVTVGGSTQINPETKIQTEKVADKASAKKAVKKPAKPIPQIKSKDKAVAVQIDTKAIRDEIKQAKSKKPKLTPAEIKAKEYKEKYEKAKKLLKKGWTLSEVQDELHIDRKRLAQKLKAEGFVFPAKR